jgi:protease-4
VIAERSSLTGSIGVIGGKLDLSGLLARIGVGTGRGGARRALRGCTAPRVASPTRSASSCATRCARSTRCSSRAWREGRGLGTAAVERAAQGRVFTGGRALALGLVDALGGPLEALAEVRQRAGLRRAEPVLVDLHPRVSALRALTRWFV